MTKVTLPAVIAGLLLSLAVSGTCTAATIYTFVNNSGSNSYQAIITVDSLGAGGTGDLTVQLVDLQTAPVDDTGLISSMRFTLSGTPGSIVNPTSYFGGPVVYANSNGTVTKLYSALSSLPAASLRWKNIGTSTNVDLSTLTGGQPANLIMADAPAGTGGVYNGGTFSPSISNHNPEIIGTATFVFANIPGISSSTVVSAPTFGQGTITGTESGTLQSTAQTTTSEPSTWAMLLGGTGLLMAGGRRRQVHATSRTRHT